MQGRGRLERADQVEFDVPAGFRASSCGPVMNPSSDIAIDTYT